MAHIYYKTYAFHFKPNPNNESRKSNYQKEVDSDWAAPSNRISDHSPKYSRDSSSKLTRRHNSDGYPEESSNVARSNDSPDHYPSQSYYRSNLASRSNDSPNQWGDGP